MNEYNNTTQMYDRLVQTVAMTALVVAFTTVYTNNEASRKINSDNSNNSNPKPTIEAILVPEEKLVVSSYDIRNKKSPNSMKRNNIINAFTKSHHDNYSKINTKTSYKNYIHSRY